VRNEFVRLTKKEYEILELLMKSPGRIYSAEQIYESVWKQEAINTETIMVHIRKLREKIELNSKKPEYLKVVWGLGYKIEKM
jgi:DNA-binding response OmpR family regulator